MLSLSLFAARERERLRLDGHPVADAQLASFGDARSSLESQVAMHAAWMRAPRGAAWSVRRRFVTLSVQASRSLGQQHRVEDVIGRVALFGEQADGGVAP